MFELNFHPFSIIPNFGWLPLSLEICCRIISELSRDVSRHANSISLIIIITIIVGNIFHPRCHIIIIWGWFHKG